MQDKEKVLKETIEAIKPFEKRRSEDQAFGRLRTTYKALNKHEMVEKEPGNWGWVPKSILNDDRKRVSSKAYGLLVVLAMNSAAKVPVYDSRKIVPRVDEGTILRWLGLDNNNRKPLIAELLGELVEAGIIKRDGKDIELLFPTVDEAKEEGFCKIYTSTYQAILEHSHGVVTLNRLAVYLGIRYWIFEGRAGGPHRSVIYNGRGDVAWVVDLSTNTVENQIHWFMDNDILSWNLVRNRNRHHNTQYYLSEKFNADELFEDICYELKGGHLLRVLS